MYLIVYYLCITQKEDLKMKNGVWLSRHPMTCKQMKDLQEYLEKDVDGDVENITWAASSNESNDVVANKKIWRELFSKYEIITGVFPPVALEALKMFPGKEVYTPVSKQDPSKRVGDGPIPFVHLRWVKL